MRRHSLPRSLGGTDAMAPPNYRTAAEVPENAAGPQPPTGAPLTAPTFHPQSANPAAAAAVSTTSTATPPAPIAFPTSGVVAAATAAAAAVAAAAHAVVASGHASGGATASAPAAVAGLDANDGRSHKLPSPNHPVAPTSVAVAAGTAFPTSAPGDLDGDDTTSLQVGRACASPFDWSDTLQRTPGGSTTPRSPYETLPSPPVSPRAHRAWSTSAVPDRTSVFPPPVASMGLYGPLTPGSAGSFSGSTPPGSALATSGQATAGVGTPLAAIGTGPGAGGDGFADDRSQSLRVDLDKVFSGEEVRTTVMVRNIPNKYTAAQLRAVLDSVCPGGYDYLYLPMDFSSHCNVGYAFVNFSTKEGIMRFHRYQDGRRWELHHSDKVCELRFARIQGREALILEHQKQFAKHGHRKSRPVVATRPAQASIGL